MKLNKHFFFIASIFALLAVIAFFKYDMENGWYWLIPFSLAVLAGIFILLSRKTDQKTPCINVTSIITCPFCAHKEIESIPDNACEYFYVCKKCNIRLKPKEGDYCVYSSYGTEKGIPVQAGKSCC